MRTRFTSVLTMVAALALVTAGVALAATLKVSSASNPTLGKIVVSSGGLTLYHNTKETNGKIACNGACLATWPPLLVTKTEVLRAGPGINASKLGRIKRPDGHFQATYYGQPLYRFSGDSVRGDVNGEGLGGIWFVLKTNGALAKPSSPSTTTTGTTTTTPYGY